MSPRLSLALLVAFALVAGSVELGWWVGLDHSVKDRVATLREDVPWNTAKLVFDIATPQVVLPITLAIGALIAWRKRQWTIGLEAGVRVGLVVVSVLLLKPLLATSGPTRNSVGDHGGAFPSGHTTSTLVCVALVLAWAGRPRQPAGRVAVNVAVVAVVAMTVIYLSYHFVSDVVGGVLLGLLIATVPLPRGRPQPSPEPEHVRVGSSGSVP